MGGSPASRSPRNARPSNTRSPRRGGRRHLALRLSRGTLAQSSHGVLAAHLSWQDIRGAGGCRSCSLESPSFLRHFQMNFPHTFDLINLAVRVQLLLFSQGLSRRPVLHPVSSEALPPHPHKKAIKRESPPHHFLKQGVASYCTSGAAVEQAVQRFLSSFCPAVQVRRSCSSTRSELTCGLHHRRRCHFAIIVCDFSLDTGGPS